MARTPVIVIPNAVQLPGLRSFAGMVVPVGATAVTLAMDRSLAGDSPLAAEIGLDLSLDGGVTWIPWGRVGAVGGTVIHPRTGLVQQESGYEASLVRYLPDGTIEPGFEPTNPGRRLRGSINLNRALRTRLIVTLDDEPVPERIEPAEHPQSVAFQVAHFKRVFSVVFCETTTFTIAGTNRAAVVTFQSVGTVTAITGNVGGVAVSAIAGARHSKTGSEYQYETYGCIAPPTGSQTARLDWTTSTAEATLGVIQATGVNQAVAFNNGNYNSVVGTSMNLVITSAVGDMTSTACTAFSVIPTTNKTSRWTSAVNRGDTAAGAATVTHTYTRAASDTIQASGVNFIQWMPAHPVPPLVTLRQAVNRGTR